MGKFIVVLAICAAGGYAYKEGHLTRWVEQAQEGVALQLEKTAPREAPSAKIEELMRQQREHADRVLAEQRARIAADEPAPAPAVAQPRSWQELELEFQQRQRQREREWEDRQALWRAASEAQAALRQQCAGAMARIGALQTGRATDPDRELGAGVEVEQLGAFVDQHCRSAAEREDERWNLRR
jgi:hypothetical protein